MPHVVWAPRARADLEIIFNFYARRSRSTAFRAMLMIEAEALEIPGFPDLGSRLADSNYRQRQVRFGRGAFLLVYDPTVEPIVILRVRHSRQTRVAK